MSGKVRQRGAANPTDSATLSVNERILKDCHSVYIDPENGLVEIAKTVGLQLLAPRKKISILLIGNHSAGKSSFINWYVEEHVQQTGVAIETQGFTFVTSGRKRESLKGNATLHLYPHFEPLRQFEGVMDYMTTEVSTSKQKKFSLVTFADTPGLVDGDMKYPFDVDNSIMWLGDMADMIFVFFDPMGQALCKRTLNLVERLNERHAERMRFYLSKADEAGHEADRQKVLMQIVQELCKRPGLNRTGFDMPTIYVPTLANKGNRCVNQIEKVCQDIEKTINQTIQNTLNSLENDCKSIASLVDERLQKDREDCSFNLRARFKGACLCCLGIFLPMILLVNFLASAASKELVTGLLGLEGAETLSLYLSPVRGLWAVVPEVYHAYVLLTLGVLTLFLLLLAKLSSRRRVTLTRKQRRQMAENRQYVKDVVIKKKQQLFQEYLQQCVSEHDL